MQRILITGGAGFVGSSLAIALAKDKEAKIICLDNLSRRGSELNIPRLQEQGIEFIHGDVRNQEDLEKIGPVDWLLECSAEPSVHAGYGQNPSYLINTNLVGLIHCLEHLRKTGGQLIFLSTSRVYPITSLRQLPLIQNETRFKMSNEHSLLGVSKEGINEAFPLKGARSLYGATKLAGELLIEEYQNMYQIPTIINRCGVLAGPWQMGKVDQGFMALWTARHVYGGELNYIGFGGEGRQVRDVLHVDDLADLIQEQMQAIKTLSGEIFHVGGGIENSISLKELTSLIQDMTQKACKMGSEKQTREADVPYYVTDYSKIEQQLNWKPVRPITQIVHDLIDWLDTNHLQLKALF